MVIVDIMNGLLVLFVFILFLIIGRFWVLGIFGEIICKLFYFLVGFFVVVFILIVVVMGLDCFMVVYVIIRLFMKIGVKCVMVVIWVLVGLLCILYFYIYRLE